MHTITVPFTSSQVDRLNQYQTGVNSVLFGHPFTCPHRSEGLVFVDGMTDESRATHSSEGGDRGLLVATEAGWVCPHCGYVQDWAHAAMAAAISAEQEEILQALLADSEVKTSGQLLLDRTDKAIADYVRLRLPRARSRQHTAEEDEKSQRIGDTCDTMVASLLRRRLALCGVVVSSRQPPAIDST